MTSPSMAVALAIVGGLALIVGGITALWCDRITQLAKPNTARPFFVRYVSLATMDLVEWPHWIFVGTMSILCPCIVAVSWYMAAIGRDVEQNDDYWVDAIESKGTIAGFVGPILAAFPMGTALGSLVHVGAAVVFLVMSLDWSGKVFYVGLLWSDFNSTWQAVARAVGILPWVAVGLIVVSFYHAMIGSALIEKYQLKPEENPLAPEQIFRYRLALVVLAAGEISQALTVGISLLACSVVLADLTEEQMKESKAGLYGGIAAAYAIAVAVLFYATNSYFIKRCQTHSYDGADDTEDNNDDAEMPDTDRPTAISDNSSATKNDYANDNEDNYDETDTTDTYKPTAISDEEDDNEAEAVYTTEDAKQTVTE